MSTPTAPPTIFSPRKRAAALRRMVKAQANSGAPHYVLDDMVEDVLDRLAFLRHEPADTLLIGDRRGALAAGLANRGAQIRSADPAPIPGQATIREEAPLAFGGHDFIASLGTLDTVNDLPGALIHLRDALAPGGLLIASFPGAGSLPRLREAMLGAESERPAARMHPMVDVRAGAQLLQRAGFADPVADGRSLTVRFGSLPALVADLRAQGLGNMLASPAPPLSRATVRRACELFLAQADADGKVSETFEIVTLTGRKA